MTKKISRLLSLALAVVMVVALLAGCGQPKPTETSAPPATQAPATQAPATEAPPAEPTKTLKIGCTITLTGTWAANGAAMKYALEMFMAERNNIMGDYKVEVIVEDDEGQVETALNKVRKLVEKDNVDILFGSHAANVGYAIGEYAVDNEIPYLVPCVAAEDLTQRKYNKYVIRTGWATATPMHPFGEWAYEKGYRKIAAIAFDYAFGYEGVAGFQRTFEEKGGEIVLKLFPATGTTDYVPFLSQIPSDVDAIFAHFNGADSNRVLTTIRELGFTCDILGASTLTDEHILSQLDKDAALGVYSALHYCATSEASADFVAKFEKAYGFVPSYYAMEVYAGLQMLEAGLQIAGGVDDIDAFTAALRSANVETSKGVITLDEYNNPVQDIYIRQVQEVDGVLANVEIARYEKVSQFWTYGAEKYLADPVYGKVYNGK